MPDGLRRVAFAVILTLAVMPVLTACRSPMYNRIYAEEVPIGIRDDFLQDRDAGGAYGYWPETHSVGAAYVLLSVGLAERFDSVVKIHSIEYVRGSGEMIIVAEEIDVAEITRGGYNPDDWYFLLRFEVFVRDVFVFYPDGTQWGSRAVRRASPIFFPLPDTHGLPDPVQSASGHFPRPLRSLEQQTVQLT